ncbi:MAG: integrase family protein [Ilumatobacteraceae bacterium]|nr:integrase family protein [Ilumatobacteraceae bacterium]
MERVIKIYGRSAVVPDRPTTSVPPWAMTRIKGHVRYHHGAWRVSIMHEGKRVYRTVHVPDDHQGRRIAERERDLLLRQYGEGYCFGDITVPELMDWYLEYMRPSWNENSFRTRASMARTIALALPVEQVRSLTHAQIRTGVDPWRAAGLSDATVYSRVVTLKAALNAAVRAGMLDSSPADHFPNPKKRGRVPTIIDMATIHAKVQQCRLAHMRMAALLALATGARRSELLALQWDDVDFKTGEIRVAATLTLSDPARPLKLTKTGKVHIIAVDPWTMAELKGWKQSPERRKLLRGRRTRWVFFDRYHPARPWSPYGLSSCWFAERSSVGLATTKFHDFRHVHATAALAAGIPVHAVAERLAHTNPATVIKIYGHAIPAHDHRIADVMEEIFAAMPRRGRPARHGTSMAQPANSGGVCR